MNYAETLSSYQRLLEANPGHALVLGCDCVAILQGGRACGAPLIAQASGFKVGVPFEFEYSGWDTENECWESDVSSCETEYAIRHPDFVPIPLT